MYVIIIGGGGVGGFVAEVLVHEQHEVVIVESDHETARRIQAHLDVMVVEGSGVSPHVLQRAGVASADLVLAVTHADEVNLIACMIAKKHGSPALRTVAQVEKWYYAGGDSVEAADLDAVDALIQSERAIATTAIQILRYAGSGELREFADGKLAMVGMRLGPESPLIGTIAELRDVLPRDSLVVAVHGQHGVRIPGGRDRLAADERAYIMTLPQHLTELTILSGLPWFRVNRVLLLGVGNTGYTLARELTAGGFSLAVLERDRDRAEWAAAHLSDALVLHGDASDPDLLRRTIEDQRPDAVVVLLRDPERSLLLGLFAKSLGAKKVIVRCDKPEYAHLAHQLGVDAIISRKRAVANAVLRYVSRGQIESMVMLGDEDDAGLVGFRVPARPPPDLVARPLRELEFPPGTLLAAIVRRGVPHIARGDTMLAPDDELLVACRPETIARIEAMLAP